MMRFLLAGLLALGILAVTTVEGAEVKDLITKLTDKDSDTRRAAAKDLAEMGGDARAAVPALIKALRDKDTYVRRFSAEALGKIGPEAKSGVKELALAMNDPEKEVGVAAVEALPKLGPDAIGALTTVVKDSSRDAQIRKKAALGLGSMGKQARGAVGVLSDVLTGKIANNKSKGKGKDKDDNDVRVEAATALGSIAKAEDTNAINALKSVAEGKQRNKGLQKVANTSLKQITGSGAGKKKD